MTGDRAHSKPDGYWDRAGEQGYGQAMYRSSDVEAHVRGRVWQTAIDIAGLLGVPADGRVLDLGCGDGAFTNQMLAGRYRVVDGIDKSEAAIKRANAESRDLATYRAVDLVTFDYDSLPRYDAAFLIGILHHVKQATPDIVRAMARRTDKMIVLEPNGSQLAAQGDGICAVLSRRRRGQFPQQGFDGDFRGGRLAHRDLAAAEHVPQFHAGLHLPVAQAARNADRRQPFLERALHRRHVRPDARTMSGLERPAPAATFSKADMLAIAALLGGFIGVVLWFDRVDFYHKHFFDTGAIVFADNMVRIVFVGIFSWLIYAPGAAVAALVSRRVSAPRCRLRSAPCSASASASASGTS